MFRFFRRYQKTLIVVGGVILMFVFTVADPLSQWMQSRGNASGRTSPNATAVTWDGGKLTEGELDRLVRNRQLVSSFVRGVSQYGYIKAQTSEVPVRQRVQPIGLIGENWNLEMLENDVVLRHILADRARDMGVVISDNAILEYINELGMGLLGSDEMYEVLASINPAGSPVPEQMIYSALRQELLAEAALRSYGAGSAGMFSAELPVNRWEEWKQTNDRAKVEAAAIDPKSVMLDVPEPTDDELRKYYEEHKDYYAVPRSVMNVELPSPTPGFMEPPKVSLQYLRANYDEFVEKYKKEISDEEIAKFYEENKGLLFVEAADFEDMTEEETAPEGEESSEEQPSGEEAVEETTEESMSEESPAEEPAAEEATSEEPAPESTEQPAEESPEATKPAEEAAEASEEAPAEPTTEEPSSEEPGAAEEPSAALRTSPFRLASYQPESGGAEESAAEESEATEESAEAESSAAEAGEETTESVVETEEEVKYQPLEEVADDIRQLLAREKFFDEVDSTMQQIATRLYPAYSKYLSDKLDAEALEKDPPEPPVELRDLAPLAEEFNLEFEKTGDLNLFQLRDTDVGQTINPQDRMVVALMSRGEADLYEPILTAEVGRFGDRYLVMKTGEEKTRQPKFEEIKDRVAAAWKHEKAAEIALERAKEDAKKAQESGLTLAEYYVDQPDVKISTTPAFSRLTLGDIAPTDTMPNYRLSQPEGLKDVGPKFLEDVFKLQEGEVTALPNFDKSIIYIVRMADQEESIEQLRSDFLETANFWPGRSYFFRGNIERNRRAALDALLDNVELDWKRPDTDEADETDSDQES